MSTLISISQLSEFIDHGFSERVISELEPVYQNNPSNLLPAYQILLSKAYMRMNKYDLSRTIIENLIFSNILEGRDYLSAISILGETNFQVGNIEEALKQVSILIQSDKKQFPEMVLEGIVLESKIMQLTGNLHDAISKLSDALDNYKKRTPSDILMRAIGNLGFLYAFAGELDQSITCFKESYKLSIDLENFRAQVITLNNLSQIYEDKCDYEHAQDYIIKARILSRDRNEKSHFVLSTYHLGKIYLTLGRMDEALNLLSEAQTEIQSIQAPNLQVLINQEHIRFLIITGDYDKAEEYIDTTFKIAKENKLRHAESILLRYQAIIKSKVGEFIDAIQILEPVIVMKEDVKLDAGIIEDYNYLVEWALEVNNIAKAEEFYTKLKTFLVKTNHPNSKKWLLLSEANLAYKKDDLGIARRKLQFFLKEVTEYELLLFQIRSNLKLAQISLIVALWHDTQKEHTNAYLYLTNAINLAKKISDFPSLLYAMIALSELQLSQEQLMNAKNTLIEAKTVAMEKKLFKYGQNISGRLTEIHHYEQMSVDIQLQVFIRPRSLRSAIQGVAEVLSFRDPFFLPRKENIFLNVIFYAFMDIGPAVIYSMETIDQVAALSSGVFIYTAVGQGAGYRTGLFGPLPFGNDVALISSAFVTDNNAPDIRLNNKNFLVIALVAKEGYTYLIDREKLKIIIKNQLDKITDLSKMQKEDFYAIASNLLKYND